MNEVNVTLTRDELQDLWFACCKAEDEAERDNRKYTAKDLCKLREKLFNIIMNN